MLAKVAMQFVANLFVWSYLCGEDNASGRYKLIHAIHFTLLSLAGGFLIGTTMLHDFKNTGYSILKDATWFMVFLTFLPPCKQWYEMASK